MNPDLGLWFNRILSPIMNQIVFPHSTILSILGIFFSFITFLPLMILANKQHHPITISDQALDQITVALNSNLYIHTSIGALCCTFPLFCDHILDILMAKYNSTTIPQSCLILSIAVPSIVLYQASLHGSVSVGLYTCAASSQELLYFAAILSFHSHFSKYNSSKLMTMLSYFLFAVGIMLTGFYNTDLIPEVMNHVGIGLVIVALIGIYGSFVMRLSQQIYYTWSKYQQGAPSIVTATLTPPVFFFLMPSYDYSLRENVYIYILVVNVTFRLLLFQFISHEDADSRAIHGQPYYIMINTISVVFLSILNSRQLKLQYYQIQNRFETKRNFVRYISHEIRTPLNCVQIGIELALIQIKSNGEQKTQPFQSYSPETATVAPEARGGEGGSLALPLSNEVSTLMKGDGDSDQSIIELLEDTYLSCQTAVEILNDILSYDKLEASDMKLNYSVVDVKSLLERCISPFSVQARQKHVHLNFNDPSLIPEHFSRINVSVDVNRFGQVIRNIISNALKFTPEGGVISISTSEIRNTPSVLPYSRSLDFHTEDPSVENQGSVWRGVGERDLEANISLPSSLPDQSILRIDISDTGPGITKAQQQSLLKEVVQFHDPHSSNANGAGLGLWISKSIIDLHGGTLSVSSEGIPGRGATFTICLIIHSYGDVGSSATATLPLPVGPKISPTSLPEGIEMAERNYVASTAVTPIALCVDDSSLNRKFLGKFLGKYFRVIYCVNGLEAVDHVKNTLSTEDAVSIIFMDNVMPVMDGLEATSQIRSLGFLGPIVGVTGNCLPEQLEEFSEKGASMIVQKPLKLESFGKLISDVMGNAAPEGLRA